MKIIFLLAVSLVTTDMLYATDEGNLSSLEATSDSSSDFDDITPMVIQVETSALDQINLLTDSLDPEKEEPKDTPPPVTSMNEQENIGAKVTYKNKVVVKDNQTEIVDQELIISLSNKFFEQNEDQILKLSTGHGDKSITLTYKRDASELY